MYKTILLISQQLFNMAGLIGSIIGFLIFRNFWGAILGGIIGSMFGNTRVQFNTNQGFAGGNRGAGGFGGYAHDPSYYRRQITQNDFATALLVLSASVMKADGKILKSELDFVKMFLKQQFPPSYASQQILKLKDILKQNYNLSEVCADIRQVMNVQQRSMLVQYLFGIAKADDHVSEKEVNVITQIASLLGISAGEFEQLKGMFYKSTSDAYQTLGIEKDVPDEAVKKAYRKMAVQHHPDKYSQMGEEHQKAAKERFQKIQDAYETIKKERGLK